MIKTIWDYPVRFKYGHSEAYGPTFHTGEDRTITDGDEDIHVTVNGVNIGIVGSTGLSTGLHTHIGKWKDGRHHPPNGGGKTFKNAIVTYIQREDVSNDGKFVRIHGDGYDWLYLHMDSIPADLHVGQRLIDKEDDMLTDEQIDVLFRLYRGDSPSAEQRKRYVGKITFEELQARIKKGAVYLGEVEKARNGTLDAASHLPSGIRKVYKQPGVDAIWNKVKSAFGK